jgi:fibronectin-binding autotransporter adhesin
MTRPLRQPSLTAFFRYWPAFGIVGALVSFAPPADATVYTWTGGNGDWAAPAYWSGSVAASADTTELDFASSAAAYVSTDDINSTSSTVPFELNILTNATGSGTSLVTLAAAAFNQLEFVADGAAAAVINQNGGGTLSLTAPVDLSSDLTIKGTGIGEVFLTSVLTGPGSLTVARTTPSLLGVVLNDANNSYSGGTFLTAGNIVANAPGALGSGTVTLGGAVAPKLTLSTTGGTYANNLVVTGTNATIEADVNAAISGSAATTIAAGKTLTLQNSTTVAAIGTLTDAITGSGSVAKANIQLGSWVLAGNNTYTGQTSVSAGLLAIKGTTSGQGSYSVTANAATSIFGTLAGSGTIGLAAGKTLSVTGVSTALSGVLEPTAAVTPTTASIGSLTVVSGGAGSSVTLGNLSTFSIAVGASDSSSELILGNAGTPVILTLAGTNTLALTTTKAFDGSPLYTLAHYFTSIGSEAFANLSVNGSVQPSNSTLTADGVKYDVEYNVPDAGGYDIQLVAVPEPSALACILALLAICRLYQRSRARQGRLV